MREGQYSHGMLFCEKWIALATVYEEEPKAKEKGLMTVDEFIASFEKRSQHTLTNNLSTHSIRREKEHVT